MIKAKNKRGMVKGIDIKFTGDVDDIIMEFVGIVAGFCQSFEPDIEDGCRVQDFVRELVEVGIDKYEGDRRAAQDGD